MDPFLESTDVIDWTHPSVLARARLLRGDDAADVAAVAKRCFEWVRDEIKHTSDYGLAAVTCNASDVLREGSGYCFAKSHLLAGLLRANGIPAGLCYQRLSVDGKGAPFCLHGLNAVLLPEVGWYRVDPRGNRPGVDAQFTPPLERLAFAPALAGEGDLPGIRPEPLPLVVHALRTHTTAESLQQNPPDTILEKP
jgi:transglutaminase-like putative cysteine protease